MPSKQKRFDVLLNALYVDLFRYACWLCGNRSMAEDLVQETYLRAWRSFEKLKDEKAAKAWLITILRRENARQYERIQPRLIDIEHEMLVDTTADITQSMESHMLQLSISKLELEFREPLMLQVIGGFSTDEIADILTLNKNTVLTRLFRARNKLKIMLVENTQQRDAGNG
ncbi:MAG: sigma-70 family RNA polymerase sigma factor [Gammaproteobacteria bacterium]|nr:sigma-70 family RNA polymerase sigma factor [Gammaproteobacteria bacterium]